MSFPPADESLPPNKPSAASSRASRPSDRHATDSRDDAEELAELLDEMSAAAALGDFATASEITLAALDRYGGDEAPMTTAWLCQHLAGILRDAGEPKIAAGYQQLALKFAAQAAEDRCQAVAGNVTEGLHDVDSPFASAALTGRALDALAKGDLDSCERWLGVAFGLEQRRGDVAGMAADWGNLAIVSLLREDWAECVYRLRQAWRLHQSLFDHEGCGRDLLNMAEVLWRLKRPRLARRLLIRAAERFAAAGSPWLHDRALDRRTECRNRLSQVRLAGCLN
jgi:hypothetical protein